MSTHRREPGGSPVPLALAGRGIHPLPLHSVNSPPMKKQCPACGLSTSAAALGYAFTATTHDGQHHAVVAICRRCVGTAARIPPGTYRKMLSRAAVRAMGRPEKYLLTFTPDSGAARLAVGLLGHPAYVLETLNALGWDDGIDLAINRAASILAGRFSFGAGRRRIRPSDTLLDERAGQVR